MNSQPQVYLKHFLRPNMHNYGLAGVKSSAFLCFLILAPTQLKVFFRQPGLVFFFFFLTTSPQFFHSSLSANRDNFLWEGSRLQPTSVHLLGCIVFVKTVCHSPPQCVPGPLLHILPLHSLLFHTPSKALCSVPFLPLPRVLFDTPGMLMGQSETLSLRISLWLIFIPPPPPPLIYNLCCLQLQMFCSGFYSL